MLHVISTPIGNMDDITLRALETLKKVDYLFCEDTRVTNKLLEFYNIKKSLFIYNDFSNDNERQKIIKLLKDGKNVGIVSDAGTPLISDPGYKLIKACHLNKIKINVVCGASAFLTALVSSGMPTDKFLFYGFIDNKKELNLFKYRDETIILYESPKRVLFLLQDILEILGNIDICICRELTKIYEEIKNGKVAEILDHYKKESPKGEFVILLKNENKKVNFDKKKIEFINNTLSKFMNKKNIADFIVKLNLGDDKKEIYNFLLSLKSHF
jgi:16S rRNA (cytidine1402-2'-O)-methyltransferase